MKNKVAYITGGTKGIGLGIAKALHEQGVKVAISGRNHEEAVAAVRQISEDSSMAMGLASDVRNPDDEQKAVQEITNRFGQIDFVIANAGVGIFKPVDQLSEDDWQAMIDTNLTGIYRTLKATVEDLKKTQGYFITISSLAGTNFFENGTGYNASKFGAVGFTQAAMLDLRKYNIKVSTIMPGSVATHFNGNTPSEKDNWKIQPEDIGQLVVDLLEMNPRALPSKVEIRPAQTGK
ncbi:SDR family oxidoreductase [Chryseobacterium salipaludis]|uniref:SDR family oxidoreductase n=1 Tax=Chryseobacterium TaxID=59732 RepID=UPI001FF605D4|nr:MULTISPECIES: SDR family oxidoreductase [Chryseobacterium]MCJ8497898.1 SDR family oxidoreductase [Chryseobacterium salipaludis]MCX3296903.1 SDR family oxidoreductase [Planobacterium sp. JC490]